MALVIKDRVLETSTTTGTGTLTLAGAVTGYQSFSAIGDGNTTPYTIFAVDGNGVPTGDWETGVGTYTASGTTLARTTVVESSNAGAAVNFSAGTKMVACGLTADYVSGLGGGGGASLGAAQVVSVDAGEITITGAGLYDVRGEVAEEPDDLDVITGGSEGDMISLFTSVGFPAITLRHNAGNIQNKDGADIQTGDPKFNLYIKIGSNWQMVAFSTNISS